jgi:hypothetical protein
MPDNTPVPTGTLIQYILAILTTAGLFAVIGFMLIYPIPASGHDAMLILIGALAGGWATILGYYFGTSLSSQAKNALITK